MNPQKRRAIFERLRAANPHPRSELAHRTPFEGNIQVPPRPARNGEPAYYVAYESGPHRRAAIRICPEDLA